MSRPSNALRSLGLIAILAVGACEPPPDAAYQGYVEGEFVYLGASQAGELTGLEVARGQSVEAGDLLFQLEDELQSIQIGESRSRIAQAQARLADLGSGRRPSELAALEARVSSAKTKLELAGRNLARREELFQQANSDAVAEEELDRFRSEVRVQEHELERLVAELETARLGGREEAVVGARAEVEAARAGLAQLEWQLAETRVLAPASGLVQDTLYREGEFVPAGRPVVSLLPPENRKVRFFVPEPDLAGLQLGDSVSVSLDGSSQTFEARITFLSPEAEFTPPVIYSKESRSKLVYLIEASPDPREAPALHVGQPVDVRTD